MMLSASNNQSQQTKATNANATECATLSQRGTPGSAFRLNMRRQESEATRNTASACGMNSRMAGRSRDMSEQRARRRILVNQQRGQPIVWVVFLHFFHRLRYPNVFALRP